MSKTDERERIEKRLKKLIGKYFFYMSRMGDSIGLWIGQKCRSHDLKEMREHREYALHIQCAWRLINTKNFEVILGSYDMFLESSLYKENYDAMKWDDMGTKLYDEKHKFFFENRTEDVYIKDIKLSKNKEIEIIFSNDTKLETFAWYSHKGELWRLFETQKNTRHLVVEN